MIFLILVAATVFLVEHGETEWDVSGRITGEADVQLSSVGRDQTAALCEAFASVSVSEVLSSPLLRAISTAEPIAAAAGLEILRDPRLADARAGAWSGRMRSELLSSPTHQQFLAHPLTERIYGQERLKDVLDRALRSVEQALAESASHDVLLFVTHGLVIQVLLAHYLGVGLANYRCIGTRFGTASILRSVSDRLHPQVLAVNVAPEELHAFLPKSANRTEDGVPIVSPWADTAPIADTISIR